MTSPWKLPSTIALGLALFGAAAPSARAETCSASGFAKTNGSYAADRGPCTLNADNYFNSYLASPGLSPSTDTHYANIVVDFAGTTGTGFLRKLTADRVGACPNLGGVCRSGSFSFVQGDDPAGQPDNETKSHANVVLYNPDPAKSNHKLLVFLSGHRGEPKNYTHFMLRAAQQGYHVIGLAWVDYVSADSCHTAAWGNLDETKGAPTPSVDDCITQVLRSKLEGAPLASAYAAHFKATLLDESGSNNGSDSRDSVINRMGLLLDWLIRNYPDQGWDEFRTVPCSGIVCIPVTDYSKVALAAHSMGSNAAYLFAHDIAVERVIMTSGPEEYILDLRSFGAGFSPTYVGATGATAFERIHVFCSLPDGACVRALNAYLNGFGQSAPGGLFDVDGTDDFDPNRRMLFSNTAPPPSTGCGPHTWLITDCDPARPEQYRDVWDWLLSHPIATAP